MRYHFLCHTTSHAARPEEFPWAWKSQPRWLPLKAAAKYSAIGRHRLKSLARDGAIAGFPDPDSGRGDWIFDRLSIDKYREAQAGLDVIKAVADRLRHEFVKAR